MNLDHIYTAGLMDGEGTVGISQRKPSPFKSPYVSMSSTTPELMEFLKDTYGGAVVKQKTYQDHHKKSWSWRIFRMAAVEFLKDVSPYMKEPEKIRRANMIIIEYPILTRRNGKYSESEVAAKLDFETRFYGGGVGS